MKPKPFVSLNHFTVPVAIRRLPSSKRVAGIAVPAQGGHPERAEFPTGVHATCQAVETRSGHDNCKCNCAPRRRGERGGFFFWFVATPHLRGGASASDPTNVFSATSAVRFC